MSQITEYEFNAEDLCRAWLSVATAAAEDVDRPLLYRAVAIEVWPSGVRLTATDSMMLWTSFVPTFGTGPEDAPLFEELPDQVVVACDEDFRARDLLKFAFKTVTAKDAMPQHLKISVGPAALEEGQFPGTEREQVAFSFPAHAPIGERVVLRALEGVYPEWRSLVDVAPKSAKVLMLNPELLHRVVSVKRFYGEPMQFRLSGSTGAILLEPREANYPKPKLLGAVMPIRKTDVKESA